VEKDKNKKEVSRRDFLVGAGAVVATSAIGAGILGGCGKTTTETVQVTNTVTKTVPTTVSVPTTVTVTSTASGGGATTITKTVTSTASGGGAADPYAFLASLPAIADADIVSTTTKDIVVIGASNCGHVAALLASKLGASVVCMEAWDHDFFYTHNHPGIGGGGYPQEVGTVNSKWMMAKGAPFIPYADFANQWQRQQASRCNPFLIQDFYKYSGSTIDWLISDLPDKYTMVDATGKSFEGGMSTAIGFMCPPTPEFTKAFPTNSVGGWYSWIGSIQFFTRMTKNADGTWPERGRFWQEFCQMHIAKAQTAGAVFEFGVKIDRLLQNANGDVIGCMGVDKNGKYHKYLANKGVLLACGGFEANLDMVLAFANQWNPYYFGYAKPTSVSPMPGTGESLAAAIRIGALLHLGPTGTGSGRVASLPFRAPWPQFDSSGKRFSNEFTLSGYAAQYLPNGKFTQISDSKWPQMASLQPYGHGSIDCVNPAWGFFSEQVNAIKPGDPKGGYVAWTGGGEINTEAQKTAAANTFCANTIPELLDLLGITGDAKANTIASITRYNQLCAQGNDDDFGKPKEFMIPLDTPPYYGAVGTKSNGTGSVQWSSGLAVDENYNVRKAKDMTPIKGLFAAGNAAGGKMVLEYGPVISGIANGTAITTGRLAALCMLGKPKDTPLPSLT